MSSERVMSGARPRSLRNDPDNVIPCRANRHARHAASLATDQPPERHSVSSKTGMPGARPRSLPIDPDNVIPCRANRHARHAASLATDQPRERHSVSSKPGMPGARPPSLPIDPENVIPCQASQACQARGLARYRSTPRTSFRVEQDRHARHAASLATERPPERHSVSSKTGMPGARPSPGAPPQPTRRPGTTLPPANTPESRALRAGLAHGTVHASASGSPTV